ncbi:TIGR02679 family protein [Neobacillus niacini]|uniref:TIGR02679 family protein n=1 Tax=Neobacillus niacini TaxID=86668 RepID=UPI0021CB0337|nr:TIGR02679 family protein [Neobacillus niacini]MCM3768275.1 TIGR02679 family protein [Neobacillus niacini]
MSEHLNEAINYLQSKEGFRALFRLFRAKYESLGRIAGNVKLSNFSHGELEEIALFMGVSPHHLARKGTVSLTEFELRLSKTRFSDLSLFELLEGYYGEPIRSKREEKEELASSQKNILELLKMNYQAISIWFRYLEKKTPDTLWIWRLILEPGFEEDVRLLCDAYTSLPDKVERYPVFSQRVSGNPHSLDLVTVRGKLWIHLLHVMSGGEGSPPSQTEAINDLLLSYQLLRDDIANFVTTANLVAYSDGNLHPVWQAAAKFGSVLNIPLRELLKMNEVRTYTGEKEVFVVENSGVFSALVDAVPKAPLICTHGQFKLAGLKLMDLLAESGHHLYYSGDFDPEGIGMALRFKERYGEHGHVWRMTVDDYQISTPIVGMEDRQGKLLSLQNSILGELATAVLQNEKFGYQEGILHLLIQDLES